MYLKAMLRGIYQGPPADWQFRREVEEEARRVGIEALHERLALVDPLSAAKLHKHDIRRIIRALEVYKITGTPLSHQQLQFEEGVPGERCRVFVLGWPRAALHRRIDARVEWMFSAGLIDEVRGLLDRFGALGRTASQAVGYREAIAQVRGEIPWEEAVRRVRVRTHQFARRQETWFRSLSECRRIEPDEHAHAAEVARRLVDLGRRRCRPPEWTYRGPTGVFRMPDSPVFRQSQSAAIRDRGENCTCRMGLEVTLEACLRLERTGAGVAAAEALRGLSNRNSTVLRTHTCGELGIEHVGQEVTLCGWVDSTRDHGGAVFLDLRDRYGKTQIVAGPEAGPKIVQEASRMRNEFVVRVTGKVAPRPQGTVNPRLSTGTIELRAAAA